MKQCFSIREEQTNIEDIYQSAQHMNAGPFTADAMNSPMSTQNYSGDFNDRQQNYQKRQNEINSSNNEAQSRLNYSNSNQNNITDKQSPNGASGNGGNKMRTSMNFFRKRNQSRQNLSKTQMSFFVSSNCNDMSKSELELRSRYNLIGIMNKKGDRKSRKGNSDTQLDDAIVQSSFQGRNPHILEISPNRDIKSQQQSTTFHMIPEQNNNLIGSANSGTATPQGRKKQKNLVRKFMRASSTNNSYLADPSNQSTKATTQNGIGSLQHNLNPQQIDSKDGLSQVQGHPQSQQQFYTPQTKLDNYIKPNLGSYFDFINKASSDNNNLGEIQNNKIKKRRKMTLGINPTRNPYICNSDFMATPKKSKHKNLKKIFVNSIVEQQRQEINRSNYINAMSEEVKKLLEAAKKNNFNRKGSADSPISPSRAQKRGLKLLAATRIMEMKNKKVKSKGSNQDCGSTEREIRDITVFDK
ncbi:UNKNOWN [Stylonychia lemnae]|uniref:Uncharacterized protein n=1 Tax=Stylonychia lemnae TaxID=5949 RepID=A0A078ATT4_STYLE|nr:UNKNOWN [Stylonychia lemnae]|eukprot:CDW84642.1 UNKNOWN [Stylonychia lemnae]